MIRPIHYRLMTIRANSWRSCWTGPSILAGGEHFLIDGLKGLLREGWSPILVHKVAEIALTLHHIPATREAGLDLFERLMDVRSYGLDERIAMIDRPAIQQ